MERETVNAITSLARTQDWKAVMEYVAKAEYDLLVSLSMTDPKDEINVARSQGAITAFRNILRLEEIANEANEGDES